MFETLSKTPKKRSIPMADLKIYKRPLLARRKWIRGELLDILSRNTVLHLDAYAHVMALDPLNLILTLEYSEGGRRDVARDQYLVTDGALIPVWEAALGAPMVWGYGNAATFARVHKAVLGMAECALGAGSAWSRVSLLCHYIQRSKADPMARVLNTYRERSPYRRKASNGLLDIL